MKDNKTSGDPKVSGGDFEEATPDPIPNSEVKLFGADGTAREAVWESRTLPGLFSKSPLKRRLFFFVFRARPGQRCRRGVVGLKGALGHAVHSGEALRPGG